MSFKSRMILKLAFLFTVGVIVTALGVVRGETLFSRGVALLVIGVVLAVRFAFLAANGEKLARLETDSRDERTAFVVGKSYSLAFWVSLVAEFAAACALDWFRLDAAAQILNYVICFQALVMVAGYLYFTKKY